MKMRFKRTTLAAGIALVASGTAYADLNNGLVAYYPFSGHANDASENGNDGSVQGATLTNDRFGNANSAYLFDGVGDYINVGHATSLDVNHHTIASWIKTDSTSETRMILGKVNAPINEAISFYLLPGGYLATNFATGSEQNHNLQGSVTLENEQWYFVAMTYDGEKVTFYVNGIIDAEHPREGVVRTTENDLAIGRHGGQVEQQKGNFFFHGVIDEVRIYSRALSESEIQALYNQVPNTNDCDAVRYASVDQKITFDTLAMALYNPITDEPNGQFALFAGTEMNLTALPGFYDFEYGGGNPTYTGEIVVESDNCYPTYSAQQETVHFPKIEVPLVGVLPDGSVVDGPSACYEAQFQQATTQASVFRLTEVSEVACQ